MLGLQEACTKSFVTQADRTKRHLQQDRVSARPPIDLYTTQYITIVKFPPHHYPNLLMLDSYKRYIGIITIGPALMYFWIQSRR